MAKKLNKLNFLHSHPTLEKKLGIGNNLVIVDREDWEKVRHEVITGNRNFKNISERKQNDTTTKTKNPTFKPISTPKTDRKSSREDK